MVHEFFNERSNLLNAHLESLTSGETTYLTTHKFAGPSGISQPARDSVARKIQFSLEIQDRVTASLPIADDRGFAVLHIRVPDERLNASDFESSVINELNSFLSDKLKPAWGQNIIVLSNNSWIKQTLTAHACLKHVKTAPVHLGDCKAEGGDIKARDTLVDFALLSRASQIYSYSHYPWQSGFSKQCAEIYGIPFSDLKDTIHSPLTAPQTQNDSSSGWMRGLWLKLRAFLNSA